MSGGENGAAVERQPVSAELSQLERGAEDGVALKTVAICGTAGSSRAEVFSQPDEVELWGLNRSYAWMPRWDRWFELHDQTFWPAAYSAEHWEWLRSQDGSRRIYLQRAREDVPGSVAYPLDEVTRHGQLEPYFTSTITYMLALAISEGFEEIRLLGVNMSIDSEYGYQRAACEYWLGVAASRGVRVYLPPSCPLLRGARYGAESQVADPLRVARDTLDGVKTQIENEYQAFANEIEADLKALIAKCEVLGQKIAACHGAMQGLQKVVGYAADSEVGQVAPASGGEDLAVIEEAGA